MNAILPARILVADDDADDRLLMKEAFTEVAINYCLTFVENGEQLIEHLRRLVSRQAQLPDLVLLDLNMPLMDGRESLREINRDPILRDIPAIVLTTSNDDEDRRETLSLGIIDYIVKPTTYAELLLVVRSLKDYSELSRLR